MAVTTVRLFANLRRIAGGKTLEVPLEDGATVRDLIEAIRQISPEIADQLLDTDRQLPGAVHVVIDGRHASLLDGLDTVISPDAEVVNEVHLDCQQVC